MQKVTEQLQNCRRTGSIVVDAFGKFHRIVVRREGNDFILKGASFYCGNHVVRIVFEFLFQHFNMHLRRFFSQQFFGIAHSDAHCGNFAMVVVACTVHVCAQVDVFFGAVHIAATQHNGRGVLFHKFLVQFCFHQFGVNKTNFPLKILNFRIFNACNVCKGCGNSSNGRRAGHSHAATFVLFIGIGIFKHCFGYFASVHGKRFQFRLCAQSFALLFDEHCGRVFLGRTARSHKIQFVQKIETSVILHKISFLFLNCTMFLCFL